MKGINKQFKITLLILVIFFGGIFLWNLLRGYIIQREIQKNQPITSVSVSRAVLENFTPSLGAVGTLSAINGVSISTQVAGNIVKINFESGQHVKKDDLLVQIDDRTEQAQLLNDTANLKLTEVTYLRNKQLVEHGSVSKQAFDEATAKYQQAQAAVAGTQAAIDYKHITAPFDGKIGIRNVNLGQYVRPGDNIVSLQALNTLYVNFYLPEKYLHQLYINQPVILRVDSQPQRKFTGKINALNSLVDTDTHNISVQATVSNQDEALYPGLFAKLNIVLPTKQNVITVPQTAINYTLYGDTVFVVKKNGKDDSGKDILVVSLREVTTGDERDNKVVITQGLKAGEWVVSSGQLKLANGERVVINNQVRP